MFHSAWKKYTTLNELNINRKELNSPINSNESFKPDIKILLYIHSLVTLHVTLLECMLVVVKVDQPLQSSSWNIITTMTKSIRQGFNINFKSHIKHVVVSIWYPLLRVMLCCHLVSISNYGVLVYCYNASIWWYIRYIY